MNSAKGNDKASLSALNYVWWYFQNQPKVRDLPIRERKNMLRQFFKVKTIYDVTQFQVSKFFKSLQGGGMSMYFKRNYISQDWGEEPVKDSSRALRLATIYGDHILKCGSSKELLKIWDCVKKDIKKLIGYEDWLKDLHDSRMVDFLQPDISFEDTLNGEGKKALKAGLI